MPKLKNYGPGKRVTIWIPERHLAVLEQIENKSNFFQLALEDAVGIMTWALLKHQDEYKVKEVPLSDVLPAYNASYPLNDLTLKRKGDNIDPEWQNNSQRLPSVLS